MIKEKNMNINEKKDKLIKNEISIFDLTDNEIEEIKAKLDNDIQKKKKELDTINKKIKNMKVKIDNWKK